MKKVLVGMWLLFGSLGLFGSVGVNASGLDIALSDETASLSLLLNPPYRFSDGGGSELTIGGFISEDDTQLLHASLMARGYRYAKGTSYSLGTGMKLIAGDIAIPLDEPPESEEAVGALALGFQFGVLLASSQHNPVELAVEAFYAPSITSFSDAESYTEFAARLQIDVIPQARAYVGYRVMEFETNDFDDVKLDQSVHLGMKITF